MEPYKNSLLIKQQRIRSWSKIVLSATYLRANTQTLAVVYGLDSPIEFDET